MTQRIDKMHPDAAAMAPRWARCRAFADSADAVKAGGRKWLPKPEGLTETKFAQYMGRAEVPAAVGRAVAGLSGLVFSKPFTVEAPKHFETWLSDCDLADRTFETFALDALQEQLTVGRGAILVDYSEGEHRPFFSWYDAEDVLSWYEHRLDGNLRLVRVVLHESKLDPRGREVETIREMWIDGAGHAFAREWTKTDAADMKRPAVNQWEAGNPVSLQRRGEPLDFLPVVLFSATRVGTSVETPPLMGMVDAAHDWYALSADYKHALFMLLPTPWIASDVVLDSHVPFGPSVLIKLEKGAQAGLLSMRGEDIAPLRDALDKKAEEISALGARLLDSAGAPEETATAAMLRHSASFATLRTIASTLEQALSTALQYAVWWDTGSFDASVSVNREFFATKSSPDEIRAIVEAYMNGAISSHTMFANLKTGGVIPGPVTFEEERARIQEQDPFASGPQTLKREVN